MQLGLLTSRKESFVSGFAIRKLPSSGSRNLKHLIEF